jgi:TusA-related sulfurtransferase
MKVFETMKEMKDGQVMEVSAAIPAFARDIVAWARRTGNTLLSNERVGNDYVALVKKGLGRGRDAEDSAVPRGRRQDHHRLLRRPRPRAGELHYRKRRGGHGTAR